MRSATPLSFFLILLATIGCSPKPDEAVRAPAVRVVTLEVPEASEWSVSGTVKAEIESPLAFRVVGQIVSREVATGERVKAGQTLLRLDEKDLQNQWLAAEAQFQRARATADHAVSERERSRQLLERKLISPQAFDDARSAAEAALQSVRLAEAQLSQARNGLDYAVLRAPASGVLLDVRAEPGQVVAAGQVLAILAHDGPREVEVSLSQQRRAKVPDKARMPGQDEGQFSANLRELDAAADPLSRTWRARYRLEGGDQLPALGSIVRLYFKDDHSAAGPVFRVPLGALSERGSGSQLWVVREGRVYPEPIEVLRLDTEDAYVRSTLPVGTTVVAMGTHLLTVGQAVQVAR